MRNRYYGKKLQEGRYAVRLTLGPGMPSGFPAPTASLWVGNRCLYLPNISFTSGEKKEHTLNLMLRTPRLETLPQGARGGTRVLLNKGEHSFPDWKSRLILYCSSKCIQLDVLACTRNNNIQSIFLLGDSTLANQEHPDFASWGQMLPAFIHPSIAIANHAQSGESLKTFISSLRLEKVLETVHEGDYVFIQFGHNDQKKEWPQSYAEAHTTFRSYLCTYIAEFQLRRVKLVLVTSPERCNFDNNGSIIPSHGAYPDTVRALAAEFRLPLVDLEKASRTLYETAGPEAARTLFAINDKTHHNTSGALALAELAAQEICRLIPETRPKF